MSRIIRPNKLVGGERAAYEKFKEACRHGQEAATELGQLQDDKGWMQLAVLFQKMLEQTRLHEVSRKSKNPSGLILPN